jgi:hypothetical protein
MTRSHYLPPTLLQRLISPTILTTDPISPEDHGTTSESPPSARGDTIVATTIRLSLDRRLEGQTTLVDVRYPSKIEVQLMTADCVPRLRRELSVTREAVGGLTLTVTDKDLGTIKSSIPLPPPRAAIISKTAVFVVVGGKSAEKAIAFPEARFLTAPVDKGDSGSAENDWLNSSEVSRVLGHSFPGLSSERELFESTASSS